MNLKKAMALILVGALTCSMILTGCGKKDSSDKFDDLRDRLAAAKEKENDEPEPAKEPEAEPEEPAGDPYYEKLAKIVQDADPKQWDAFALIDLTGDGVMELFATNTEGEPDDPSITPYMIVAQNSEGEPVINDEVLFDGVAGAGGYRGTLYYLEGMGLLREAAFYAPLGEPADTIYVMEDGTVEILDTGYFEADRSGEIGGEDWDLFEHGEWHWNDQVVSEAEYDSMLEADLHGGKESAFSDIDWLGQDKILEELAKLAGTAGAAAKGDDNAKKDDLKEVLVQNAGVPEDEIVVFEQQDFDGDGKEEAFALAGEIVDDPELMKTVVGDVWFVSASHNATRLHEGIGMGFNESIRTMTMGPTTYALFDEVYATAILTYVWYVDGGKAVEAPFSAAGEVITDVPEGKDRFRIMDSEYDSMYYPDSDTWMGHTWKHYYFFYFDELDKVCEYGGAYITDKTVPFLCERDLLKEVVPKKAKIDSVFCRGNALIVINYELAEGDCVNYYHYIYDFALDCFVDDCGIETGEEPLAGICKEALCPDIASYPEVPNPDEN